MNYCANNYTINHENVHCLPNPGNVFIECVSEVIIKTFTFFQRAQNEHIFK